MEDKNIKEYEINAEIMRDIFGERDDNLKYLMKKMNVTINTNGGKLTVIGEENDCLRVGQVIDLLAIMAGRGEHIKRQHLRLAIQVAENDECDNFGELTAVVAVNSRGKAIRPKSYGQAGYISSIKRNSIVFGVGPAGTGKTYLAVAMAVNALKLKQVERIILTRPAVEAGEKLGFLPGDLGAKVDPYLRPLYDALQEMLGLDTFNRLVEKGTIEIAPLAYMRGRTLSNAFIILDEAQNTTREQMKMFLTRMGEGSRIIVTGDITQIDLPYGKKSGLIQAINFLQGLEDISINMLGESDVVRHELVMRIVRAYERGEKNEDKEQ